MCTQLVHYPYELQRFVYALGSETHVKFLAVIAENPLKILACNKKTLIGKPWQHYPLPIGIRMPEFQNNLECYDFFPQRHVFNYALGIYLVQYDDQTNYMPAYIVIQLRTQYWQKEFLKQSMKIVSISLLIIFIIVFCCMFQINRLILKPLNIITKQMQRRKLGDSKALVPELCKDEIGMLAQTLNEMIRTQEKSENLFQQLTNMAPVLLWTSNEDNSCFYFSKKWAEFTGQTRLKYTDWSWLNYFHPEVAMEYKKAFLNAQLRHESFTMECRLRGYKSSYHWMWSHCTPRILSDGYFEGYICCLIDISERKKHEEQLKLYAEELSRARDAALKSTQAKSTFLATMSHEIRTPINGILGYAYLLNETELTHKQKDYVKSIHSSTQLLLELISQILDFSKIEADKLTLEPTFFDLNECLREVLDLFQPTLVKKNLHLHVWRHPQLPNYFVGDPKRLRQIVMNLLSNATKFTTQGSIHIRLTGRVYKNNLYQLFISVKDSGIGIEPKDQQKIFRAFEQIPFQNQAGTGLGLSITKSIVELMGGNIHVHSQPQRGTTFYLTLLLKIGKLPHTPMAKPLETLSVVTAGKVILLVEDNEDNQKVAKAILEKNGYHVHIVENGYRCLGWLQKNPVNLVLMDINMPEMDGYETTQRIRAGECGLEKSGLPIIGFTAYALKETRAQCLSVGMNALLTKPLHPHKLLEQVQKYIL
ncbi:MAG: response regulator [Puniceicoccales bacterium]|jgi:PAS domain S-box-containing protein|nr:response regulator [Puniceicoccales bacterium]